MWRLGLGLSPIAWIRKFSFLPSETQKKGIKRENFQEEIPEMGFFRKKKHQYHFGGDRIISFGKDLINFREDKILFQLKRVKLTSRKLIQKSYHPCPSHPFSCHPMFQSKYLLNWKSNYWTCRGARWPGEMFLNGSF